MDIKPPVFVMGFPRSGTTAVASAICANPRFYGTDQEGHFHYLLAPIFERYMEGALHPSSLFNHESVKAVMADSIRTFFKSGLEAFYGAQPGRQYVDKTPGIEQIESIPTLLKLYPSAPVLFCFRAPVECIESNMRNWPEYIKDPEPVAYQWVELMRAWRKMRELLDRRRFAEIYQADSPARIARLLLRPLDLNRAEAAGIAEFLKREIVNTPFRSERPPPVLDAAQRRGIAKIVAAEWRHWKPWKRALHPEWWAARNPFVPAQFCGTQANLEVSPQDPLQD